MPIREPVSPPHHCVAAYSWPCRGARSLNLNADRLDDVVGSARWSAGIVTDFLGAGRVYEEVGGMSVGARWCLEDLQSLWQSSNP